MLDTIDAVMAALRDNDARPYGRPRTVTAEELVDAADRFDDTGLRAMALLELMEAYEYDGERSKAPVVFARVLKLWDADRGSFGEWASQQVFWRFKWVATSLLGTPDVPLASVRRWHGEMRDRYRAAGHGLQPYYAQRFHLAAHIGEDVQDAYELWAARPRTELSDCHACEVRAAASHLVRQGDDAAALDAWRPVLSGESTCAEEPHVSHAQALLPLLRQGGWTRPAPATWSATASRAARAGWSARSASTSSSARCPATSRAGWRSWPRTATCSASPATRAASWTSSPASRC